MTDCSPRGAVRLLLLLDRRPGHYHQVEGLAAILARTTAVVADRLEVRPRRLARNFVRRLAVRQRRPGAEALLRLLYGIAPTGLARPDIVIGSGRPTIAAGILLARHFGARFLYSGFAPDYVHAGVDLMLVRTAEQARFNNCALTAIPTLIDPDMLPAPKPLRSVADLRGASASLFLGGDAPGYRFVAEDWEKLAALVRDTARRYGLRWSVSTSRRTPGTVAEPFAGMARDGVIDRFVDFRAKGPDSAGQMFAADVIVVGEDSLSMMAEGLAALRPVVALRPDTVQLRESAEEITTMRARQGLTAATISGLTPESLVGALLDARITGEDPRVAILAAIAALRVIAVPPGSGTS